MIEMLKNVELLIGVLTGLVTVIAGLFVWWDRHISKKVGSRADKLDAGALETRGRLEKIEHRLTSLDDEMERNRVRLSRVESTLSSLATHKDIGEVSAQIAALNATVIQISTKTDTLYNAALRHNEGR